MAAPESRKNGTRFVISADAERTFDPLTEVEIGLKIAALPLSTVERHSRSPSLNLVPDLLRVGLAVFLGGGENGPPDIRKAQTRHPSGNPAGRMWQLRQNGEYVVHPERVADIAEHRRIIA